MIELSIRVDKTGLIFVFGLTLFQCIATTRSSIFSGNNSSVSEQYSNVVSYDNVTAIPSFAKDVFELRFCQSMPEFKLGSGSLLTYMMRLKLCYLAANKTWFEDACRQQLYGFTDYYRAVYVKFCQPRKFQMQCGSGLDDFVYPSLFIRSWMHRYNIPETTIHDHEEDISNTISPINISINNFTCNTILSFFEQLVLNEETKLNRSSFQFDAARHINEPLYDVPFTEWFLTYRVFCDPVACGQSSKDYQERPLSAYDCFPSTCQAAMSFIMVLDSVLAVITVIANLLVLVVAFRTTIMKNVHGYFKISLAIGDLMVGLFVLPGSVYHHYILQIAPLPYRNEGQSPHVTDYFNHSYLNFMGLFNVLSFSISIYTLGSASLDRYLAVTKPFKYRNGKYLTKKRSVAVFVMIWCFSFVIAIYPVFRNSYNISALGLILSTGPVAIVIYSVTLGLPLLVVWAINGAMLFQLHTQRKARNSSSTIRIRPSFANSEHQQESHELNSHSVNNSDETEHNMQRLPSCASIDAEVFTCSNKVSNNCCKKNKQRKKPQTTSSQRSSITTFVSVARSQIQKKFKRTRNNSMANQDNVERTLTKTLGVMVGAFTIAILPCLLVLVFQPVLTRFISPSVHPKTYSPSATNSYITAEYLASRLFLSNSFWNCIIYSIRNHRFRKALINVFICDEARRRSMRCET